LLPGNKEASVLAAPGLLEKGFWSDAVEPLAHVLEDEPDNIEAVIAWGNGTAHQFTSSSALERLAEVIGDADKYEGARMWLRPATAQADDAAAEQALRKAVRLAPSVVEARMALANFLWATGRPDEAEPLLEALADQQPDHQIINHALGMFCLARQC